MTVKVDTSLARDMVNDYRCGDSESVIAKRYGLAAGTVARHLTRAGIVIIAQYPSIRPKLRRELPADSVVARYLAGESEKSLAGSFGCCRDVIRRVLLESGVERRGLTESNRLMMSGRTAEENRRNCEAAHAAARGRQTTEAEHCLRALTHEKHPVHIGQAEPMFAQMLADRGVATVPQKAIGHYNCDLAAEPVAVEVWGGNWHFCGKHAALTPKRTRYLLDSGWSVVFVLLTKTWPLTGRAADYVAAFVEQTRCDPTARREYRMILGTGELASAGGFDDDEATIKETLSYPRNMVRRDAR